MPTGLRGCEDEVHFLPSLCSCWESVDLQLCQTSLTSKSWWMDVAVQTVEQITSAFLRYQQIMFNTHSAVWTQWTHECLWKHTADNYRWCQRDDPGCWEAAWVVTSVQFSLTAKMYFVYTWNRFCTKAENPPRVLVLSDVSSHSVQTQYKNKSQRITTMTLLLFRNITQTLLIRYWSNLPNLQKLSRSELDWSVLL